MLPDRDGYDITRLVRRDSSLAHIPIIMLTARIEETDRLIGLELGADDYLPKPFNPRELLARIRAILRRVRPGAEDEARAVRRRAQSFVQAVDFVEHLPHQPVGLVEPRDVEREVLEESGYRVRAERLVAIKIMDPIYMRDQRWIARFRREARFSTFLYRVATNAALNRRRSLDRSRARIQKLGVRQAAGDDLPYSPRDPEDATAGLELSEHVREALLDTLEPHQVADLAGPLAGLPAQTIDKSHVAVGHLEADGGTVLLEQRGRLAVTRVQLLEEVFHRLDSTHSRSVPSGAHDRPDLPDRRLAVVRPPAAQ